MKKIIYIATVILSLGISSSCTKENDVQPTDLKAKTLSEADAGDKSVLGTSDLVDSATYRDKSVLGTSDYAEDKSVLGTSDANAGDKSVLGTSDATAGNNNGGGAN